MRVLTMSAMLVSAYAASSVAEISGDNFLAQIGLDDLTSESFLSEVDRRRGRGRGRTPKRKTSSRSKSRKPSKSRSRKKATSSKSRSRRKATPTKTRSSRKAYTPAKKTSSRKTYKKAASPKTTSTKSRKSRKAYAAPKKTSYQTSAAPKASSKPSPVQSSSGSSPTMDSIKGAGKAAVIDTLQDPQVQECLSAAFNGEVPKDLSAENLKKATQVTKIESGDATTVSDADQLVLNQMVSKLRDILKNMADQSATFSSKAELGEADFEQLYFEHGFDEDFEQIDFDVFNKFIDDFDFDEDEDDAEFFDKIAKGVSDFGKKAYDTVSGAASSVGQSLSDVVDTVKDGFVDAGKWLEKQGQKIGEWLGDPNVQMCLKHAGFKFGTSFINGLPEESEAFDEYLVQELAANDYDFSYMEDDEFAEFIEFITDL